MGIKPEDILINGQDSAILSGISVRKGTFGAALLNVEIIESTETSESEKNSARETFAQLAPKLNVIGLLKHLAWKNPEIQKLFEENQIEKII